MSWAGECRKRHGRAADGRAAGSDAHVSSPGRLPGHFPAHLTLCLSFLLQHAAKGQGTLPHLNPNISFGGGSDEGHLRGSILQTTRRGTEQVARTRELPLRLAAGFVPRL